MAAEPNQHDDPAEEAPAADAPATSPPRKFNLAAYTSYALPAALAVSIVANLVGIVYFRTLAQAAAPRQTAEIPLGDYRFEAKEHEPGQVTQAQFSLHVELVHQAEKPGRALLHARQNRVQQNVEELLRMAHGGDFNDPTLKDLKGQLQKRVNETLGLRAVSDVIVTDLRLQRSPPRQVETETASVPWNEPPAG